MSDNVWNYDMSQCPEDTLIQIKTHRDDLAIGVRVNHYVQCFGLDTLYSKQCIKSWALYTPPSEPKVWIKHDNNSFPKCHPLDVLEVRLRGEKSFCTDRKIAKDWSWSTGGDFASNIIEYCIVEKHKNDSNI